MAAIATKSYGMIQQSPSGYRSVVGIRFTDSTFGQDLSKVAKYRKESRGMDGWTVQDGEGCNSVIAL